jgi:pteridine reductase
MRRTPTEELRPDELAGKVALVTGAGVRVGRAIAEELARAGARVAIHYARSAHGARAAAAAIEAEASSARSSATSLARASSAVKARGRFKGNAAVTPGPPPGSRTRLFAADLRADQACESLIAEVAAWGRRLDILVCSAAAFERRPFEDIDRAAFRDMVALNLEAPLRLAQAAAPFLRARRGLIVNILDVAAFHAWSGYAHYAASKAGLAMLTRVLALELAPRVRVCAVAPGTVEFPVDYPRSARREVVARIPLGRVGRAADVARAVRYLASADYVTGSVLAVDGGRLAGTRGIL